MRNFIFSLILRFFNLKKSSVPTEKKGKVIIFIDGLGYRELKEAIRKGYCPFFSKLLDRGHKLHAYYCEPPTSTVTTEAELFYGRHDGIPGFTWYDRTLKRFVRGNRGADIDAFEKSYLKPTELLRDGSCILGIFTGGATQLDVSGKVLDKNNPLKFLRKLHILVFVLINPIRFIYTLYLILKSIFSSLFILLQKKSKRKFRQVLIEAFSRIFLGNVSTYIAELEIMRETPVLFIDYLLYDEFAHEFGLGSWTTLSSIKLINWYCQSLYKLSRKTKRKYDFFILSDHGQTDSLPFDGLFTGNLERLVEKGIGNGCRAVKTMGINPVGNKVYLVPGGAAVHLYFSDTIAQPVYLKDIRKKYPHLETTLLADMQIGWLLMRISEKEQVLMGKEGEVLFRNGAVLKIKGVPFPGQRLGRRVLNSLAGYAASQNNGDIVIYGNLLPDGRVVAFEDHKGTHGGFIGNMTHAFIMTENQTVLKQLKRDNLMGRIFEAIRSTEGPS